MNLTAGPRRSSWVSLAVLLVGMAISALTAWRMHALNLQHTQQTFLHESQALVDQIRNRMRLYEYGLRGARGAIQTAGPEGITAELFRRYAQSRDIDAEFPGARGFGFVRRIANSQLSNFLAKARQESPGFNLRPLAPLHGDEQYIIEYIEPLARNAPAMGLDISTETFRRTAAQRAMTTGQATLSGPITLVQANQASNRSLLFLLPIYRPGMPTRTAEERARSCFGWSYAPLALDDVTKDFVPSGSGLQLALQDVTQPSEVLPLYAGQVHAGAPVLQQGIRFPIYGRIWEARITAGSAYMNQHEGLSPLHVLLTGFLLSMLVASLHSVWHLGRARQRWSAEQNAKLAAIVTHSSDAIIGEAMDGTVLHWNPAATRLFGWSETDIVGKHLAPVFLPTERLNEDADLLQRVKAGQLIEPFDTTRLSKDGELVDVSVTAGPIRASDGRLIGMAKLVRDIRDRKQAERQLQSFNATLERQVQERTAELERARRDLQTVLDAMPSLVGYWDRHLHNQFANKAYLNWFNKTPEAMHGIHLRTLLGDQIFEANLPHVTAALAGEAQRFERTLPRPDGLGVRSSLAQYLPDIQDGQVQGFYAVVHDISDLVEGRRNLDQERARLRNILDGTLTGTWEWDIASDHLQVNPRWAAIKGRDPADEASRSGRAWQATLHPEDRPTFVSRLHAHLRGESELFECESRQKHAFGHWTWVRDCGRVMLRDETGRPLKLFGTTQDIHAARQALLQQQHLAMLLSNVLQSATEQAIVATDRHGQITIFNPGAERMLGYCAEAVMGQNTPLLIHDPQEIQARGEALSQAYGQPISGFRVLVHQAELAGSESSEWTYVRQDGSRLRVRLSVTPLRGPDQRIDGYLGIAIDITKQLAEEEALRQAKTSAEEASQAKSMFLANMSHEIRTPLNAVIGATYLLEHSSLDSSQRHLLAQIQAAGHGLLGIVNDVLDLAKIEAGEVELERIEFHLGTVLTELDQMFAAQAHLKGLRFAISPPDAPVPPLVGDPVRLKQVLANLMSNAIKFTTQGGVAVRVSASPQDGSHTLLRFDVVDTGEGIAPQHLERLFQPFTQADNSTTRRFGGTGLGLSIVRQMCTLMHGQVGVQSEPGVGSNFWVSLPFAHAQERENQDVRALAIALVTPDESQRQTWTLQCAPLGWVTQPCMGGADLVARCANLLAAQAPLPDAVLIDANMPEEELTQTLETLAIALPAAERPATVVVMPNSPADVMEQTGAQLADLRIMGPLTTHGLFHAVHQALATRQDCCDRVLHATHLRAIDGHWLDGLHLLLVDDSDINLDVGERLLTQEGAQVMSAKDGPAALQVLLDGQHTFDAIVMDVQMPGMDGYETTRQLRQHPGLSALPIVALTAAAMPEDRERALAAGMNALLTKPLKPHDLWLAIRGLVPQPGLAAA